MALETIIDITTLEITSPSQADFKRVHDGLSHVGPDDQASPSAGAGARAGSATATGIVKWFSLQKASLVNAATGKDVFVHISAVEKAGLTKLTEGQQVDFVTVERRRPWTSK